MKHLGWLVCRTFIEKRKKESRRALFSFLTPADREKISTLSPPSQDISAGFDLNSELLKWTHPSWFTPLLRSFSEKEICLFLSSLDKAKADLLRKSLKCSMPLVPLTSLAQSFFKEKMAHFLMTEEVLPLEALPKTALRPLLDLPSEDLRLLIELLGLHDLAVELKQIIDSTQLKKIFSVFPKEKEIFLKSLAHKKEHVLFRRIEISRWDGKAETLLQILFQRGLNRLAKALYPESPYFLWHVKRRIEMEDAEILSSLCKSLEHPRAYSFLSAQVLDAISFIHKIKPSASP